MNSPIVRLPHRIFRLFLQLYKAQECPPIKHKAAAKFSCLVIIKWKNSRTPLVIGARVYDFSCPWISTSFKWEVPCFSIFRIVKLKTFSLHLPIQQPWKTTWQITCHYPVVSAINTEWELFKAMQLQPLHLILKRGISSDHRVRSVEESALNPPHCLLRAK